VRQGLHQSVSMRQEMKMNPRLYQAMDLLYMPMMDLQQYLKEELLVNPFLEMAEAEEELQPAETSTEEEAEGTEDENEIDWEEILLDGFQVASTHNTYESREFHEPVTVATADLKSHLEDQLTLLDLTDRQLLICDEILGNLGDDGYLKVQIEEVANGVNLLLISENGDSPDLVTFNEASEALGVVQNLEPAGIAARDLRECLMLQLARLGEQNTLTYRLVRDHFKDLLNHRWSDLAKRGGLEPRDVQNAADMLAPLDPKPGLRYSLSDDGYVTPDLILEKIDGEYRVFLNDVGSPQLRISRSYRELAADKKQFVGENKEFITSKLNWASWLIQAIEQRRQTMLKVMNFIVDRQLEFFEKGIEHLKPLTLREVAEVIDMHESTVSRVTNQKYVQTPRGVFPLKFFFSSSLGTSSGEDASARSVKAQIQKLVSEEDLIKPLTDSQIVTELKTRGVKIARRTVAKYRDQLGILPARMRKRV
jgi:RNA polymerase sigma-54 factor